MSRIYKLAVVQLLNCLQNGNSNVRHILNSGISLNLQFTHICRGRKRYVSEGDGGRLKENGKNGHVSSLTRSCSGTGEMAGWNLFSNMFMSRDTYVGEVT